MIKNKETSCAFTGHREMAGFSPEVFQKAVDELIEQGVDTFYCGMAMGFDLLAGEYIINRKKAGYDVKLVAVVPCDNQTYNYAPEDKVRYNKLIDLADEVIQTGKRPCREAYMKRNDYMVDNSSYMVAFYHDPKSGTGHTVRYFLKSNPEENLKIV